MYVQSFYCIHIALHRQPMPSVAGGKSATGTIAVPCGRPGRLRASRSPVFRQVPCSRPGRNRTILCSSTRSPACRCSRRCSRRCGTLETAFNNCIFKRVKYPTFKKKRNGGFAEFSSSAFRCRYGKWFRGLQASHHDGVALASRAITPSSSSPQPRAALGWTTS